MNVQTENKPNCIVMLHVDLPPDQVQSEWQRVEGLFQKEAKIPGFRPGKAPRQVVVKRYADDIRAELERKLLNSALRDAIKEKSLEVLSVHKVNKIEIDDEKTMRFTATLVTAPEFQLPDYKSIEVAAEEPVVTEQSIDSFIDNLREQQADFEDVEGRGIEWGDFAVLNYAGTVEGQPLQEAVPDAPKTLCGGEFMWIRIAEESLVPGFCEKLIGATLNEERSFDLEVKADFAVESFRGKTLHYDVTVSGIKKQVLPEVDDEFTGKIEMGLTAATLRERVRENLLSAYQRQFETEKRNGVMQNLLSKFDCELPEQMLQDEMATILREIVEENQMRGISEDQLREHESELVGAAQQNARARVRGNFLLQRIAEAENLEVTQEDMIQHILTMAQRCETSVDKMINDLRKHEALPHVRDQILRRKALDLVASNATVVPPSKEEPSPESAETPSS